MVNGSIELYNKINRKRITLMNLVGLSSLIAMGLKPLIDTGIDMNSDVKLVFLSLIFEVYGFSTAAVWVSHALYNLKEKYVAKLSSIDFTNTDLVYNKVEQSTGIEFDKNTVYRVKNITNVTETDKYFEIQGEISLTEIVKQEYKSLLNTEIVRIPKYFNNLENLMQHINNK